MKTVKFKATDDCLVFHGDIDMRDGMTAEVPDEYAEKLCAHFPDNFSVVKAKSTSGSRDKAMRGSSDK